MDIHLSTWPRPLLEKHSPFLALWQIATAQRRTGRPHKTLSRRWFQMLKWFGVPKKGIKNAKWIMNSVISMISFQNRRVCVLSSLLEVTTPRFFSCSAPNNPTHPLLPWPQNPVLVAPAPWSVPTNDPTPVPKKTRENPWEPTWILQFLGVSSPIYVGPRTPSFFHWNFWGSKGFFDDSFLKCWKIRAYNFGEFQTEKKKTYRHTHTHFKKDIYIYTYIDIHTRAHTRIPSPENSQQN